MKLLKPKFWEESNLQENTYDTVVETGTYRGFTTELICDDYKAIHSIELSEKWFRFCRIKFKNNSNIHLHHGDSIDKLPEILNDIHKPVIVFLDAHYCGGSTENSASTNSDTVLLEELTFLKGRKYDDIIVIDDTDFLGVSGGEEPETPFPDHHAWVPFRFDWIQVTEEKVLDLMKPGYSVINNNENSAYTFSEKNDQFIWFPKTSGVSS